METGEVSGQLPRRAPIWTARTHPGPPATWTAAARMALSGGPHPSLRAWPSTSPCSARPAQRHLEALQLVTLPLCSSPAHRLDPLAPLLPPRSCACHRASARLLPDLELVSRYPQGLLPAHLDCPLPRNSNAAPPQGAACTHFIPGASLSPASAPGYTRKGHHAATSVLFTRSPLYLLS